MWGMSKWGTSNGSRGGIPRSGNPDQGHILKIGQILIKTIWHLGLDQLEDVSYVLVDVVIFHLSLIQHHVGPGFKPNQEQSM